jgi:Sulfotransferase domain
LFEIAFGQERDKSCSAFEHIRDVCLFPNFFLTKMAATTEARRRAPSTRVILFSLAVASVGLNAGAMRRTQRLMTVLRAEPEMVNDAGSEPLVTSNNNSSEIAATSTRAGSSVAATYPEDMIDCRTGNETLDQMQVPTFIIAGAQKAGTSALYQILGMHPDIVSSRRFETHFFDSRVRMGPQAPADSQDHLCDVRARYLEEFNLEPVIQRIRNASAQAVVTFEKSPVYLCKPFIPAYIKKVVPWTKILLILRNPVDRAYSSWKMVHDNAGVVGNFENDIAKGIRLLHELDLSTAPSLDTFLNDLATVNNSLFEIPSHQTLYNRSCSYDMKGNDTRVRKKKGQMCNYLSRGMYAQQLVNWLDVFELGVNLKIVRYEQFLKNRSAVAQEILDFVGVDINSVSMDATVLQHDFSPKKRRKTLRDDMDPRLRDYLSRFYKPYNDELADLLGEEWREVWD